MRIDKTIQRRRDEQKANKRIDETKRRIDEIVKSISARIDETKENR